MGSLKSVVFCDKKGKYRTAFRTKEKAEKYIENYEDYVICSIELRPIRSFYCPCCNMWHITHFPLTAISERTVDRDRKIQELQLLVDRLRTEFRKVDWRLWKQTIQEGIESLAVFKEMPGFEKLVSCMDVPLKHYASVIEVCEAKESGSAEDNFKRMRKDIETSVRCMSFNGFRVAVGDMVAYFSNEGFLKALHPSRQEWVRRMVRVYEHSFAMSCVETVMNCANVSYPDASKVNIEELKQNVQETIVMIGHLYALGLPEDIWELLQAKSKNNFNLLENSFSKELSEDGLTKIEEVLLKAYNNLLSATTYSHLSGDVDLASSLLRYIDSRLHLVSLSKKKLEFLEDFCEASKKLFK